MLWCVGEIFVGFMLGEFVKLIVDIEWMLFVLYVWCMKGMLVEVVGLSEGMCD